MARDGNQTVGSPMQVGTPEQNTSGCFIEEIKDEDVSMEDSKTLLKRLLNEAQALNSKIEAGEKNKKASSMQPDAIRNAKVNMVPNINIPTPIFHKDFKIPKNDSAGNATDGIRVTGTPVQAGNNTAMVVKTGNEAAKAATKMKAQAQEHPGLTGIKEAFLSLCPEGSEEDKAAFILLIMRKCGISLGNNARLIDALLNKQKGESLKRIANSAAMMEVCKHTGDEACGKLIKALIRAKPLESQICLYKQAYCSGLSVSKIAELACRLMEKVDLIEGNKGLMNLTYDKAYDELRSRNISRVTLNLNGAQFSKAKNLCINCNATNNQKSLEEDMNGGFMEQRVKKERGSKPAVNANTIPTPPEEPETPKTPENNGRSALAKIKQEMSASPTFKNGAATKPDSPILPSSGKGLKRCISMLHPGGPKKLEEPLEPASKKVRNCSIGMGDGAEDGQDLLDGDMDLSDCIDNVYVGPSQGAIFGRNSPRGNETNEGASIRNASASTQKFEGDFQHGQQDEDGCLLSSSDDESDDEDSQIITRSKGGYGKFNKRFMLDEKLRFSIVHSAVWISNYLVQAVGNLEKFDRVLTQKVWVEAVGSDEGRFERRNVTEKLNGGEPKAVYVKKHCGLHFKTRGLSDLKSSCETTIQGPHGIRGLMVILRKVGSDGNETDDFVKNSIFACSSCWNKSRYPDNNSLIETVHRDLAFTKKGMLCSPWLRINPADKLGKSCFYCIFALERNKIKNFICQIPTPEELKEICFKYLLYAGEGDYKTRPNTHMRLAAERIPCGLGCWIKNNVTKGLKEALAAKKFIKIVNIRLESVKKALMYEHIILEIFLKGTILNKQKGRSPEVKMMDKLEKQQFAAYVIEQIKVALIETDDVTTFSYL